MSQLHEDLARHESLVARMGSEKSFGVVFAAVFLVISLYPLVRGGSPIWWLIGLSAVTGALAYVAPRAFHYPNRWWFKLGNVLAAIVGPVAIGIVFFVTVVPIGMLMRALGKDPLRLRLDQDAKSYWIRRDPPGPDPKSMSNQF